MSETTYKSERREYISSFKINTAYMFLFFGEIHVDITYWSWYAVLHYNIFPMEYGSSAFQTIFDYNISVCIAGRQRQPKTLSSLWPCLVRLWISKSSCGKSDVKKMQVIWQTSWYNFFRFGPQRNQILESTSWVAFAFGSDFDSGFLESDFARFALWFRFCCVAVESINKSWTKHGTSPIEAAGHHRFYRWLKALLVLLRWYCQAASHACKKQGKTIQDSKFLQNSWIGVSTGSTFIPAETGDR